MTHPWLLSLNVDYQVFELAITCLCKVQSLFFGQNWDDVIIEPKSKTTI